MIAKKLKFVRTFSYDVNKAKILQFVCELSGDYILCYAHPKTVLSMLDKKARAAFTNKGYVRAGKIQLIYIVSHDPMHSWGRYYAVIQLSKVDDLYLFFTKENADYIADKLETLQLEQQMSAV
jgi:hypothetical protein